MPLHLPRASQVFSKCEYAGSDEALQGLSEKECMRYFSMFSGIGGFELGIQQAIGERAECVGFSEIDKYAIQVYNKHFPNHIAYGDCTKIKASELPNFDLLVGGFPCQSFSIAGKRKGFDDTRGTLFFDISRIVEAKRPKYLLLENVKGLLSHDNGRTYQTILSTLIGLGYDIRAMVINAKNFGVPQNRERVFIAGCLGGWGGREVFSFGGSNEGDVQENKRTEQVSTPRQYSGAIDANYHKGQDGKRTLIARTVRSGGRKSPHGSKQNWDSYEIGKRIRRLTPVECERLMGFPDNWTAEGTQGKVSDTQRYKMCGNAIVVDVVREVMKTLFS